MLARMFVATLALAAILFSAALPVVAQRTQDPLTGDASLVVQAGPSAPDPVTGQIGTVGAASDTSISHATGYVLVRLNEASKADA